MLLLGAVVHHPLDVGAVVPGPVEHHHLARGGQVLDVALEVPLRALPLGRLGQRDDPDRARAGAFGDPLDHAALAGRAAALEDHQDLQALGLDPVLQQHQLLLEALHLDVVRRGLELALLGVAVALARRPAAVGVPTSSAPSGGCESRHATQCPSPGRACRDCPSGRSAGGSRPSNATWSRSGRRRRRTPTPGGPRAFASRVQVIRWRSTTVRSSPRGPGPPSPSRQRAARRRAAGRRQWSPSRSGARRRAPRPTR